MYQVVEIALADWAGIDLGVRAAWPLARPAGAPTSRRPPTRGAAARAYAAARDAEADAAGRLADEADVHGRASG